MENKTCGECRFFESKEFMCCSSGDEVAAHFIACYEFAPMPKPKPTNGDVIRQGGDKALLEYRNAACNAICSEYKNYKCNRNCTKGLTSWLNAPLESEVNNG